MRDIIFYDIEIKKAIPDRNGQRLVGIEYCDGWGDHASMGIATIGIYNFTREMPAVICGDNIKDFERLLTRDPAPWLIGFNNINFDNKVIDAAWGVEVPREICCDLLQVIWEAAGLPVPGTLVNGEEVRFDPKRHGGYGLDACAMANFSEGKSGDGAMAPVDWQRGNYGKVISYCLRDVMLTFKLWRRMISLGEILNPKTNNPLRIELPQFTQYKADKERR